MNVLISLIAIVVLYLFVALGVGVIGLESVFGVVIPYVALLVFIGGFIWRIIVWAKSPVPFRIPTTVGQQKSLDWIKPSKFDNPFTNGAVVIRMILEVLTFRSLFKNTRATLLEDKRLVYAWTGWLWFVALTFHYSFLTVVIRHLRLFAEPVPQWVLWIQNLDGFLQIGVPTLFMSSIALLGSVLFLLGRRLFIGNVRYISLIADYFPLMLIATIAITGILMRHFTKIDVISVKELAHGLLVFNPVIPENASVLFYAHLFFVCVLMMYFPFSKLMHMGGVFMSPTRNLANNSRAQRHINPWNPKNLDIHTYEHWEDEFREKMKAVGLPTDKD